MSDELSRRVRFTVESILEDERLTADLDDEAAKALLDWGIALAQTAAKNTAGMDDAEAEALLSSQMSATRRLMRTVNNWIGSPTRSGLKSEEDAQVLDRILEQAAIIHAVEFVPPDEQKRQGFLSSYPEFADDPPQMIADLRAFVHRAIADEASGEEQETPPDMA